MNYTLSEQQASNITLLTDLYSGEMKKQAISFFIKKHHPDLYNEIMNLSVDGGFLAKAYCYLHAISESPQCFCGKKTQFISMVKGFSKTCSYKCMGMVDATKVKRKQTTKEKYGVDNISLATRDIASEKMRNKTLEEKLKIQLKSQNTSMERFGELSAMKSKEIQSKVKKTNLLKYGAEYITQVPTFLEKIQNNNLKKYGFKSVSQVPEFHNKKISSSFKRKEYIWKSGEISIVQGYEDKVLEELESQGYSFNDIKTASQDMPKIIYNVDGKERRYFPDIYIPSENMIIEVKSSYTINCDVTVNEAKWTATKALGYNFKVIIK